MQQAARVFASRGANTAEMSDALVSAMLMKLSHFLVFTASTCEARARQNELVIVVCITLASMSLLYLHSFS